MLKIVTMPELRPRGSGYTARVKIPRDVAADYAKAFGQKWSVKASWPGLTEAEARVRCAEWGNTIDARFKALRAARNGQRRTLDHREVHARVGQWYTEFVRKYENNPGDPTSWEVAQEELLEALAMAGDDFDSTISTERLLSDPTVLAGVRDHVAQAAGADQWLIDHGDALTSESRAAFLDALTPRYADALTLIRRRADGDYSYDPIVETFPTLEAPQTKDAISITALFEQWVTETKPAEGTVRRWRPVITAAQGQWSDFRRVSDADARTWIKSLVTEKRTAYTVNTIWRTALKTVCNWAIGQGLLAHNPFTKIKVSVQRKIETRESKAFTDDEARTILGAALTVTDGALKDARRWLPWLCAYSGARAGEIAQLRGQDITERDGIWVMVLTPEAGTIKNRKPRTVPLHSHLIEQGFLEFVKSRGARPLFYGPRPDDGKLAKPLPAHIVQKVGEWVRALGVSDPEIRPNHAWRHLFKLIAERAGIPERLSDVMTGHAPASIGRAYGAPMLADLAREIEKLPRYTMSEA